MSKFAEFFKKKKKKKAKSWGSYDYGWGKQVYTGDSKEEALDLSDYKKTGVWRGYSYYAKPKLDYKYIEKMANMLASKYKVNVKTGQYFAIDLESKTLTYNPTNLMFSSKGTVLALLLHEIGHLRYTAPLSSLNEGKYLKKWRKDAGMVYNIFEDLRIDKIMINAYKGADGIYQYMQPIIQEQALNYKKASNEYRTMLEEAILDSADNLGIDVWGFKKKFKKKNPDVFKQANLLDYAYAMIEESHGRDAYYDDEIKEVIKKTKPAIDKCAEADNNQEVIEILNKEVYPVIEKYFVDRDPRSGQKSETQKKIIQALSSASGKSESEAEAVFKRQLQRQNASNSGGDKTSRLASSKESDKGEDPIESDRMGTQAGEESKLPETWTQGDYDPLYDSVKSGIDYLTRKLKFLRKRERTAKYFRNKKRGRLDSTSLYKFMSGNPRLFKKKQESEDTINEFAWMTYLDVSGSMYGDRKRITNAVRGAITISEVFHNLGMQFGLTAFDSSYKHIKEYNVPFNKDHRKAMAGLITREGGGTDLRDALESYEHDRFINNPHKRNKVVVIITDGDVMNPDEIRTKIARMRSKGVKVIGIGIGGNYINDFVDNGVVIHDANELPDAFEKVVDNEIMGKSKN